MKIKYLFCLILSVIILSASILSASAFDYKENDVIIDFIPGDIDGNGSVNALDARLCLRAAAQLETLTDTQKKAADLDGTGEITSITARNILRASAKIETITMKISIEKENNLVVGPIKIWGAECNTDSQNDKIDIVHKTENNIPEGVVGAPTDSFFTISAKESGDFTLYFTDYQPWVGTVNNTFNILLTVK